MAFRNESHNAGFSFASSQTATLPSGATAGDDLYFAIAWSNGGGAGATITSADGATLLKTYTGASATVTLWHQSFASYSTGVFNSSTNDWCSFQIIALSGRSGLATFIADTLFTANYRSPPAALSFTGATAAASDDLILLGGIDPNNSDTWTYSNGTSTAGTFTNLPGVPNGQNAQTIAQYLTSVAAGATGSVSVTANGTPSFISADFAGALIAVASGGPPPTPTPGNNRRSLLGVGP